MSSSKPDNIVIIGAGVTGLQTALTLLTEPKDQTPKPTITILASHFPGTLSPHYTSPWAGGQWRTHASQLTPSGRQQCAWDIETYQYWKSLTSITSPETTSKTGIGKVKSRYVWDAINDEIKPSPSENHGVLGAGLWWKKDVDDFRVLDASERPKGTIYGVEWTSFCINVPRHLQYLVEEVKSHGGKFMHVTLPSEKGFAAALEAAKEAVGWDVDLFINATGLSARKLVGDEKVYPTRGQTVLVKGEAKMARTRRGDGYIAYTIPRPGSGTTVLGGSNDAGNWDEEIDEALHGLILERAKVLAPELLGTNGEHAVLSRQVGFRPSREGGPRVEFEDVGAMTVLHCYGHGGAGYQNSIGCARTVSRMIQDRRGNTVIKAKI